MKLIYSLNTEQFYCINFVQILRWIKNYVYHYSSITSMFISKYHIIELAIAFEKERFWHPIATIIPPIKIITCQNMYHTWSWSWIPTWGGYWNGDVVWNVCGKFHQLVILWQARTISKVSRSEVWTIKFHQNVGE